MAVRREKKIWRKCGYRQVGGTYLMGELALASGCDRLPYPLERCPCCGGGFKFNRSIIKTNDLLLFERSHNPSDCACDPGCPVCEINNQVAGMLWVGEKFYTPAEFITEGRQNGVSKRIGNIPTFVELDKTWIYLSHIKAANDDDGNGIPGLFGAFRPTHYEKIMTDAILEERLKNDSKYIAKLEAKGTTIVLVDSQDSDHTTPYEPRSGGKGLEGLGEAVAALSGLNLRL